MKIVFLGTPEFAVESLDAIIKAGHEVAAVVTATDKPAGRGHKLLPSAVKQYALDHGIEVLQPEKLRDSAFLDRLREINADLFVVIAFRMLPEVVWAMPPMGTFNLHASLLPRYRGAAPINRAVMAGETRTGVTTFLLKHEIDTGDILRQEAIDIAPNENVGSVHDRLMHLGARVTVETLADLEAGTAKPQPQEDCEATAAPKIFKEDCRIDRTMTAEQARNHIRGLSPYPAAWTDEAVPGVTMKVYEAKQTTEKKPGHLYMDFSDGTLELLEVQPAGKKRMPATDFLRGLK
ncbi:MAG: methionyl-tRNA formyltransferase [Bacteroides sp.]|nr:methionyl-tRNA formyltransferase [Bacteroides sp.]MCM1380104.1 methionyl-tRNA formyltransferase [Bacteroides sp.]MCM1445663.1 methionyl-tRNA formyltransferase [Prevotella sp.]